YPRLWIELDHRILGGMPPVKLYNLLFSTPGFIQNCWDRIVIGSASPTLEASQVTRGIWESTEKLPFHFKLLIRTWIQRNALRIFKFPLQQMQINGNSLEMLTNCEFRKAWILKNKNTIDLDKKVKYIIDIEANLQSFSITQLLWLQPLISETWDFVKKETPGNIEHGELLVRSYHTTTSLILNEHERGNYLQIHYDLAKSSMQNPELKLHTVAAEENRADFNYPDHWLASSVGNRNIIIPISNGDLSLGGRENLYVLATFGPRSIKLMLRYSVFTCN
ncbi:MAG: YjbQ family protein, partial [Promethearchaeota archaeon]